MAVDVATLAINVKTTGVDQANKDLGALAENTGKSEKAAASASNTFDRFRSLLAGIAVGALAKEFIQTADAMTLMEARLKLVSGSTEAYASNLAAVQMLAERNRLGLEETAQLYTKLADPIQRLGGGTAEVTATVDSFSKALKLGGANTAEAAAATLQFAQAMGSGKLQGDEFKSLAEASPRFMKAMAEGMNVPIEKLKEMGSEGKLTAEVVAKALIDQNKQLTEEFAKLPVTVSDMLVLIKNDFMNFTNEVNQATGINTAIAEMLGGFRDGFGVLQSEVIGAASEIQMWFERNKTELGEVWEQAKGLGGELWSLVKTVAGVASAFAEVLVQSGFVKLVFESMRLAVAVVRDIVEGLAGAFARVGEYLLRYVIYPFSGFNEKVLAASQSAGAFADSIAKKFGEGKNNVTALSDEINKNSDANKENYKSQAMMGLAIDKNGAIVLDSAAKAKADARAKQEQALASIKAADGAKLHSKATADGNNESEKAAKKLKGVTDALKAEEAATRLSSLEKRIETEQRKAGVSAISEEGIAIERLITSISTQKEARKDHEAAIKLETDALDKHKTALDNELIALDNKIKEQNIENAQIGFSKGQIELLTAARLEEKLALMDERDGTKEITEARAYEKLALQASIDKHKELGNSMLTGELYEANAKSAKDAADAWDKAAGDIGKSLTDSLFRGFEGGKGFVQNFVDTIKNTFKTMVLKPVIQAVVNPVVEAGKSAAQAGLGSLGSMAGSLAGSLGLGGIGASFSAGMEVGYAGMSGAIGTGNVFAAGSLVDAAGLMGGMVSTFAGPLAAIAAAAVAIDQGLKSGYGGDNNREGYLLAAATMGMSVVYDKLFGRGGTNNDASGISGTFTSQGFTGERWQDKSQKGGVFSKDKRWTETSAIDQGTSDILGAQVAGIASAAKVIAQTMGENITAGLADWSYQFNLQLSENGDLTAQYEKMNAEIAKASDSLALHLFPTLQQLGLEGESTSQTLARLGQTFSLTNAAAIQLGQDFTTAFGAVGIASAAARQQLVDLSGGPEAMAAKMTTYYDQFYTSQEKNRRSLEMLDAQLGAMGVSIGLSTESFRAFIEDSSKVNLATEEGRKLYAGLMDLAPAFASVAGAMGDKAAGVTVGTMESLVGEKGVVSESIKSAAADWWNNYGPKVDAQAAQAAAMQATLERMATATESAPKVTGDIVAGAITSLGTVINSAIQTASTNAVAAATAVAAAVTESAATSDMVVHTVVNSQVRE